MKARILFIAAALLAGFGTQGFADEKDFNISGCAGFQFTRLQAWKFWGVYEIPRNYNNIVVDLIVDRTISPHFSVHAGLEAFMWFNTHDLVNGKFGLYQPALGENSAYLLQAENVFTFDEDNLFGIPNHVFRGEIHMGYFPYKYNPDVRNLGEYLFRSGTYPGWLKTISFVPESRLTGLLISTTAFDKWKNDFLMTTEMDMYPFYDLSYSWISSIKVGKILDIGGGVNLARFTPANCDLTTRKRDKGGFTYCPFYLKNLETDSLGDTISGDTTFYTFTGTKIMGRLAFDFKGLLPADIAAKFGENDGRIYGEFDILGLENQGDYYKNLSERIPVTFGFNVPTFKLLDVLSIEGEYYTMPYPDNYRNQVMAMLNIYGGTPVPDEHTDYENGFSKTPGIDYNWSWYQHDSWKWSVYFKKSLGKNFSIRGLAARDHLRNMSNSLTARDYDESLTTTRQWYWAIRLISTW